MQFSLELKALLLLPFVHIKILVPFTPLNHHGLQVTFQDYANVIPLFPLSIFVIFHHITPWLMMLTLAITSGSGSSMGSAHSTVTTLPQTFTLPLISRRRAWAAVLWSSYSRKQKPRFFFLSSGWWYNMTSLRPSVSRQKYDFIRFSIQV